jgi:solute carrier family 15 (oligopeptide transporter), member 1
VKFTKHLRQVPISNIIFINFIHSQKAISNRFHSQVRTGHSHWLDFYFDTHFCASDARCQELQRKKRDPRACHKVGGLRVLGVINLHFTFQRQFIADIKGLLRLLVMYLPAPMFWALYDQQGSRWLIQSVSLTSFL